MTKVADTRTVGNFSRAIAALPSCEGGLGVPPIAYLADPCYVAGKLAAARSVDKCDLLSIAVASMVDLTADPIYATESAVHSAIDRFDAVKPGTRSKLTNSKSSGAARRQSSIMQELIGAYKHDLLAGRDNRTRALLRSNAGNPHLFASAHGRNPTLDINNIDFCTTIHRRLRLPLSEPSNGQSGGRGLCDGCNKSNCADEYGDSQLWCNAKKYVTELWHDPMVYKIAELARMNGLQASNGVHAPPANPLSGVQTDLTIRGILPNGGTLYIDVTTATVTCKSQAENGNAAVVDGAAAASAAAAKIRKHRDLILAANPDNRFAAFAVEEGGRIGSDAQALVDVMVRAGSTDPTTWLATKTFCMRALATTTAKGIARIINRPRLRMPRRRPAGAPTRPPTAALLAHLAHIAPPDGTIPPVPPATAGVPFSLLPPSSPSPSSSLSSSSPLSPMLTSRPRPQPRLWHRR